MAEPVTALSDAVQSFASAMADGDDVLVSQALLLYEIVGFNSDGSTWRRVAYSCPTDNFSLTGALGLVEAARYFVRRDVLDPEPDDE